MVGDLKSPRSPPPTPRARTIMKRLLTVLLLTSATASGASAADQAPYQVLRPGDKELSCEVLAKEINDLNAEVLAQNKQAQRQAKAGRTGAVLGKGAFAGLARGVSIIGYGSTSPEAFAGLLASNVAAGVAQEAANAPAAASEPVAPAQVTPQQQRLTELTGIYRGRPC